MPGVDLFNPTLFASESLVVSTEQENAVRNVLLLTSSDSQFASKAAAAIRLILTKGSLTITGIVPPTRAANSPSATVSVIGVGYTNLSKILINGSIVPTLFISSTQLSTNLDLTGVTPRTLLVTVQNSTDVSNTWPLIVT